MSSPETNTTRALSLAKLGWPVFPIKADSKRPLIQWAEGATTDTEQIVLWWEFDYPGALIGIHAGRAGLVIVDVDEKGCDNDRHPDDCTGSGSKELERDGIVLPKTFHYRTKSGGEHYVYRAPEGVDLTIAQDYPSRHVDIRSGTGYVVYHGPILTKAPKLAVAPESVLKRAGEHGALADMSATVDAWLARTRPGKPTKAVREALEAVHEDGMDRAAMLAAVTALVKLGHERGAGKAFADARATYTRKYPDYAREWDNAAEGSVRKFGLPPVTFTIPKAERKAIAGRLERGSSSAAPATSKDVAKGAKKAKPAPVATTIELDAGQANDLFGLDALFDVKWGLKAQTLAEQIGHDLATGIDGMCWEYRNGVWTANDTAIETRTIRALGDRYRPAHASTLRSVILNGGTAPILRDAPNSAYLNVRNGMLDWRTGDLLPHDPSYLSTIQLNVEHDPNATAPHFEAWLRDRVPADAYKTVLEVLGYLFMSGNPQQKAVLLYGPGSNGKSTLLRLVRKIVGNHHVSSVTLRSMSEGKFETASLFGKLLNVVGDIDAKYLNDASTFKAITGDDLIQAQHKGARPFEFVPWAVPVFSANKMWASADTSDGYFRRWLTIPFPFEVAHDPDFSEAIFDSELPGILNLAVAGLQRLHNRGEFKQPKSIRDLLTEFRAAADVVATWLDDDDRVIVSEDTTQRESRHVLYSRFRTWAMDNGYTGMASATFYERLRGLKYHEVKSNGVRMFGGLTVRGAQQLANVTDIRRGA